MILIMLVKKVVYQLMAAGPILLLGMIAVNSRAKVDTWQFIEYGPETSARLFAYATPIREVRSRFVYKDDYDEQDIHETIDIWLKGYRNGDLQDIFPATTMFEGSTSAYQQVVAARHKLVYRAREQAELYFEEGEYEMAAELFTDILEVANIAKYGEFAILADSANTQAAALNRLIELSPKLTEDQRARITKRISRLDDPKRSLAHIISRISAAYRIDLTRQGRSTAVIEAARANQTLASADDLDQLRIEEWRHMSTADRALIPLYARSRMAYLNTKEYDATLVLTLEAMKHSDPEKVTQS